MRQFKKMMTNSWLCPFFLIIFLFSVSVTAAQDKVVVIPLFDEKSGPPAPVPKTGQTYSELPGDDGYLEIGVAWPNPRFTDNDNGTVTDNLTALIWLKNANCAFFFTGDNTGINERSWYNALTAANSLTAGYCGLTDGSLAGDWRLPNIRELYSLADFDNLNIALPSGHPFTGVHSSYYWSSTTNVNNRGYAWRVNMDIGVVLHSSKGNYYYVWPVRGGND